MLQKNIGNFEGILLVEPKDSLVNASIHMFFMNFNIATIWVNNNLVVVDKSLAKTWRPYYAPKEPARFILETHPDRLNDFEVGDIVKIENA